MYLILNIINIKFMMESPLNTNSTEMSEVSQKQSCFDEFEHIPIKKKQTHNKMKKNELSRRQSYFDELEDLPTKKHK